ncbi:uncharacterized protein LOC130746735 isoform X1 [Lotus japonicus]|uniref:uncharacterized protein LOC130746735 isoform X1 n=1 Tax=Lotus japonicus TaxID=34305 RepID=UPI0025866F2A|nr:uncharacterized protein LOC130746735 isoform X1 [Lotus japonicus]
MMSCFSELSLSLFCFSINTAFALLLLQFCNIALNSSLILRGGSEADVEEMVAMAIEPRGALVRRREVCSVGIFVFCRWFVVCFSSYHISPVVKRSSLQSSDFCNQFHVGEVNIKSFTLLLVCYKFVILIIFFFSYLNLCAIFNSMAVARRFLQRFGEELDEFVELQDPVGNRFTVSFYYNDGEARFGVAGSPPKSGNYDDSVCFSR